MSIAKKVALITGGCQGIGKEFAKAVLQRGGKVAVLDIDKDAGNQFTSECAKENHASSFLFLPCDVTDTKQLNDGFRKAKEHYGQLDVICNNAGVTDEFLSADKVVNINLTAVIQGTRQGIEYLSKANGGSGGVIINVGSMTGVVPIPTHPVYSASKSGVVSFTRSFKGTLGSQGIRVNGVCPVFVKTGLMEKSLNHDPVTVQALIDRIGIVDMKQVIDAFFSVIEDETLDGDIIGVTQKAGNIILEFPMFGARPLKTKAEK